jgi:hypothetical protein
VVRAAPAVIASTPSRRPNEEQPATEPAAIATAKEGGAASFFDLARLLPLEQDAPHVALALQQIGGSGALFSRAIRKEEIWNHQIRLKNSRKITVQRCRRANLCDMNRQSATTSSRFSHRRRCPVVKKQSPAAKR